MFRTNSPAVGRHPSHRRVLAVLALAGAAIVIGLPVAAQAQGPSPDSPKIDRRLGEEEEIRLRREWFLGSRLQGVDDITQLAARRQAAVEQTRAALRRQAQLRAEGRAGVDNSWIAKGPSPSGFGGWTFGNVSGRVSSLAADWAGGALYVGTASGGLWRSTNDGLSYEQLLDSAGTMTVGTVAIDPNDPNVLWVGTGENVVGCESYFGIGLLRSGDGGVTWEPRNGSGANSLNNLSSFANVIVDPRDSNHLVTGGRIRNCGGSSSNGGLYVSFDGGQTWTGHLQSRQVYEIAQDPTVQDNYWVATDSGLYRSFDNGVSWVQAFGAGLPTSNTGRTELAIAPSDSNVVYALFSNPLSIWRTTDGGSSWQQRTTGSSACDGQCSYNMVLRVDPFDSDTVYRGTVRVFRSINGGTSWSDLSNSWGSSQKVHQDTHALLMDPTQADTFYVGSDGGVWKSVNAGSSFINRNGNLNVTQFYAIGTRADDPETICGGAQDNSSLARTGSDVWSLQAVTGDGFVCAFDPISPNFAYITSYPSGGFPNVWRSSSGAFGGFADITGSGSGVNSGDRSNWVTPYVLDPVNPTTLYLGTHRVYRSDNRGTSWSLVSPDLTGNSGSLKALEVNRSFPDVIYSGSESGDVWRSPDGGATWSDLSAGLPGRAINDVGADPTNSERAFAVVGGFGTAHLWEWNLGSGWVARGGGLPDVPANTVLVLASDDVMVGTDVGIFRSYDGGVSFTPYMTGLPEGLVVTDLKYNLAQNLITAGTYGRGAWQVSNGEVRPILLFDSIELPPVEIDGDGDAQIEPGESWAVRPLLRNGGGLIATNVSARLVTGSPGIQVLEQGAVPFEDIAPGQTGGPIGAFTVTIDPDVDCGNIGLFDLIQVISDEPQIDHGDKLAALNLDVNGGNPPGPVETAFADDFDPAPENVWSSEGFSPGVAPCAAFPFSDIWNVASKDGSHGQSYHAGQGAGGTYQARAYSWLYYGGKDSAGGEGFVVPEDAVYARLNVEHLFDTKSGIDGGQVLVDAVDNGQDVYVTLQPIGGYPSGSIATGQCNGLEGLQAFQGDSGGWTTASFDLLPFRGQRIHLAFLFSSGRGTPEGEGWWIDDVQIDVQLPGPAVCDVTQWPGSIPATVQFDLVGPDSIQASWGATCNDGTVPGQTYSIQAGDLDALRATGSYNHAAIGGSCDQLSPALFAPGAPTNEYFLVVPADATHQGSSGRDSTGAARPSTDPTCGALIRETSCP